jgi:hypothetical protein
MTGMITLEAFAIPTADETGSSYDHDAFVGKVGLDRARALARQQRLGLNALELAIERVASANNNGESDAAKQEA